MKRHLISLTFLLVAACAMAAPRLRDLDIHVTLSQDGSALIRETRHMDIDGSGTEMYIVLGNLGDSELSDMSVTDESGASYIFEGAWDVNRSRSEKAGLCGIVTTRNGYELCWGLGQQGARTYVCTYRLSGLVRSFTDADGFNFMFVAEGLSPRPEHVLLTIEPEDTTRLTDENTSIWAFRYRGEVNLRSGAIVAETSEPFTAGSAMIVMARFAKGLFAPSHAAEGTFDELSAKAFEKSDYLDDSGPSAWEIFLLVLFFVIFPLAMVILYFYYIWRMRRKVFKDLSWWRDIPYGGDLQAANNALNAFRYLGADYNNLLSACILRLIDIGGVSIEQHTDARGKTKSVFAIHPISSDTPPPKLIAMVHEIFEHAAGADKILEPQELKNWMRRKYNQSITDNFVQTLHTKTSLYQYQDEIEEVRRLFGLRKYLKEFSLLSERNVTELSLWKDYMIYAALFGIADQVIADMKKINPDYFGMDSVAQQMADDATLPVIRSTLHNSTSQAALAKAERAARASGRGGSASWSGGGGFSGGGFGGGVR